MIYWRRYGADYLISTIGFTAEMDGIYGRLLDHYYEIEGPLPLDFDDLVTVARATRESERDALTKVITRKFERRPDGYHHKRADAEIALAQQARENGGKHVGKSGKDSVKQTRGPTEIATRRKSARASREPTETGTGEATEKASETVHPSNRTTTQPSSRPSVQPSNRPTGGAKPPETSTTRPKKPEVPPVVARSNGNGEAHAEPKADQPAPARFASDSEIPWWHSPAGIQAMGLEQRLQLGADEDWREYSARVMAAAGPGPWDQEQPVEQRERIEQFRAMRSA